MRRTISLSLLLSLTGCWNLPEDDAGDRAYVTWATTAILGRSPASPQELRALMVLESEHGREALLDTLMQQPEFVDHWDDLLMQQLQVGTDYPMPERGRKKTCYTEAYVPPSYDWALSEHLRSASWKDRFCVSSDSASDDLTLNTGGRTAGVITEAYTGQPITSGPDGPGGFTMGTAPTTSRVATRPRCFEFTMKDVLRASLRTDRMDALLRAHLAPLAAFDNAVNARRVVFDAYFDRHQDCMECHTTTYSTTDPVVRNQYWDRYFPAVDTVDLEFSAFWTREADGDVRDGSIGGNATQARFRDLFARIRPGDDDVGVKPWAFDEICLDEVGLLEHPRPLANGQQAFAGWGENTGTDVRILDFVDAFGHGLRTLADGDATTIPRAELESLPDVVAADQDLAPCGVCHVLDEPPGADDPHPMSLTKLTATMSAERVRRTIDVGSGGGGMEGVPLDEADRETVVAHLMTVQGNAVQIYDDPTVAMAHLTALSFVDGVAEHLSGRSLTLEHGFPRNEDQAYALRELADGLIENDWSLRYVIKTIALSELVNRRAPDASVQAPYVLPPVVDPWHDTSADDDADPLTGVDRNGQGDLVHRWPVATLIRKRNAALGWRERTHFDDAPLRQDLGGYVDFDVPGFGDFDMASALAWEANQGPGGTACRSPHGGGPDAIDALLEEEHDLTVFQALNALKFRLVGEPISMGSFDGQVAQNPGSTSEYGRIASELGVAMTAPAVDHESEVRDYCAVLLSSPQFLLAGLPIASEEQPEVDYDVPCLDDQCRESDWCELYRHAATDLGYASWTCPGEGTIGVITW